MLITKVFFFCFVLYFVKRVKPEEDNVRFYWIPNDAKTRILTIGSEQPEPTPDFLVI